MRYKGNVNLTGKNKGNGDSLSMWQGGVMLKCCEIGTGERIGN